MTKTNTLLAVDGNSLIHRSFHALQNSGLQTRDGRPTWAIKGFMSQLLGSIERVGADSLVVGFDDHTRSVRKEAHPDYKATRKPKPPELGQQLALVVQFLRSAGVHVVVPAGLEADDVLASASAYAPQVGWRTVVVTSDRDSFALIDDHTRVLRIINGGVDASPVLNADRLQTMYNIRPHLYPQFAALRGDPSDNLPGIRGIGEVTAAKLLTAFGSVQAAFDDVDRGGAQVAAALGKSFVGKLSDPAGRDAFARNMEIMRMHKHLPLGLELTTPAGAGVLPLNTDRLLAALDDLEFQSLRDYAARVLCRTTHLGPAASAPSDLAPVPDGPVLDDLVTHAAMRGSTAPRPSVLDDLL